MPSYNYADQSIAPSQRKRAVYKRIEGTLSIWCLTTRRSSSVLSTSYYEDEDEAYTEADSLWKMGKPNVHVSCKAVIFINNKHFVLNKNSIGFKRRYEKESSVL
jgi:hypothetical protein